MSDCNQNTLYEIVKKLLKLKKEYMKLAGKC